VCRHRFRIVIRARCVHEASISVRNLFLNVLGYRLVRKDAVRVVSLRNCWWKLAGSFKWTRIARISCFKRWQSFLNRWVWSVRVRYCVKSLLVLVDICKREPSCVANFMLRTFAFVGVAVTLALQSIILIQLHGLFSSQ
jgi:hypothetical protein